MASSGCWIVVIATSGETVGALKSSSTPDDDDGYSTCNSFEHVILVVTC